MFKDDKLNNRKSAPIDTEKRKSKAEKVKKVTKATSQKVSSSQPHLTTKTKLPSMLHLNSLSFIEPNADESTSEPIFKKPSLIKLHEETLSVSKTDKINNNNNEAEKRKSKPKKFKKVTKATSQKVSSSQPHLTTNTKLPSMLHLNSLSFIEPNADESTSEPIFKKPSLIKLHEETLSVSKTDKINNNNNEAEKRKSKPKKFKKVANATSQPHLTTNTELPLTLHLNSLSFIEPNADESTSEPIFKKPSPIKLHEETLSVSITDKINNHDEAEKWKFKPEKVKKVTKATSQPHLTTKTKLPSMLHLNSLSFIEPNADESTSEPIFKKPSLIKLYEESLSVSTTDTFNNNHNEATINDGSLTVTKNYKPMKMQKCGIERQNSIDNQNLEVTDNTEPKTAWKNLDDNMLIDIPEELGKIKIEPVRGSVKENVQTLREQSVLQDKYFTKNMIPNSREEPDEMEIIPHCESISPLNDIAYMFNDVNIPWPDVDGEVPYPIEFPVGRNNITPMLNTVMQQQQSLVHNDDQINNRAMHSDAVVICPLLNNNTYVPPNHMTNNQMPQQLQYLLQQQQRGQEFQYLPQLMYQLAQYLLPQLMHQLIQYLPLQQRPQELQHLSLQQISQLLQYLLPQLIYRLLQRLPLQQRPHELQHLSQQIPQLIQYLLPQLMHHLYQHLLLQQRPQELQQLSQQIPQLIEYLLPQLMHQLFQYLPLQQRSQELQHLSQQIPQLIQYFLPQLMHQLFQYLSLYQRPQELQHLLPQLLQYLLPQLMHQVLQYLLPQASQELQHLLSQQIPQLLQYLLPQLLHQMLEYLSPQQTVQQLQYFWPYQMPPQHQVRWNQWTYPHVPSMNHNQHWSQHQPFPYMEPPYFVTSGNHNYTRWNNCPRGGYYGSNPRNMYHTNQHGNNRGTPFNHRGGHSGNSK